MVPYQDSEARKPNVLEEWHLKIRLEKNTEDFLTFVRMLLRIEAEYAASIRDVNTYVSDISDETRGIAWDMDINGEEQDKPRCKERLLIFDKDMILYLA